ncbi:CLUMA_CG001849, isoform A [Clunio marinus]|uniref:Phosphatidylethanolamine N-methyltransferase n=1 Tax=Clunio marinus TaxID=568069 RepID=A0A1J1HJ40_9DIPT|nr:CLUMA_CG001849, isoform A [Clunio marinus]
MSSPIMTIIQNFDRVIDWKDPLIWLAAAHITFNPFFWNVSARLEYKTKLLSRIFGSTKVGCYVLAVVTFLIGMTRNFVVVIAVTRQLSLEAYLGETTVNYMKIVGGLCMVIGLTLAITSMLRLGVTGTYLGDYFGMLKDSRVTAFPFNVVDNPMYVGSTITFLGLAVLKMSPIGFLLTVYIWIVYNIALFFEEPFTAKIYSTKETKEVKAN